MRIMKTTAVAIALAVGGLTAPISSPMTASDAVAGHKHGHGVNKRVVVKKTVIRRPGVRVVDDGRYFYDGRYYDHNEALTAGLIGLSVGAIIGNILSQGAASQGTVPAQ